MSLAEMDSADFAVSIEVNTTLASRCRGVYIGVSQSLDFSFDGTNWILFKNCVAGTILPIQVIGARKNAGSAAPDAGDVLFLY